MGRVRQWRSYTGSVFSLLGRALEADYHAALAAHDPASGVDTVRIRTFAYDVAGNQIAQYVHVEDGVAITERRFDRFNQIVRVPPFRGCPRIRRNV